jgi:IS30 family transposase
VAANGPRPAGGRYLSLVEREEIAVGVASGQGCRAIAARLGRHPATVGREIRRDSGRGGAYRAVSAHLRAGERARRPKAAKLAADPRLRGWVQARLEEHWSPEQVSVMLKREFPGQPEMQVPHETICQPVYVQGRGALRRELAVCLRTGRALRKPRQRADQRRGRIKDMVMISERPAGAADRAVPGHWEGDLIIGKGGGSAIGTLAGRMTRFCLLLHLPASHDAAAVAAGMTAVMASLPAQLRRSLTWDQGKEMSAHRQVSLATDLDIYFCDPHAPWQRGSNENTCGLLRQYFPKGTGLSRHSRADLDAVAAELNARPARPSAGGPRPRPCRRYWTARRPQPDCRRLRRRCPARRRACYGAAPPASRLLRIASRPPAAGLDPVDPCGPCGQSSAGRPGPAPPRRAAPPRMPTGAQVVSAERWKTGRYQAGCDDSLNSRRSTY